MTSPYYDPHCHVIAMEMGFMRARSVSPICGVIFSSSDTWAARTYNQSAHALFASPILFPLTGETLCLAQYLRRHLIWSCCCGNRARLVSDYCQGPVQLNIWETDTFPSSLSLYSRPPVPPLGQVYACVCICVTTSPLWHSWLLRRLDDFECKNASCVSFQRTCLGLNIFLTPLAHVFVDLNKSNNI